MDISSLLRGFTREAAGTDADTSRLQGNLQVRKSSGELVILAFLGVLGCYVTVWSELNLPAKNPFGAGVGPRLFPQTAGVVMMLLSLYLVLRFLWQRRRGTLDSDNEIMELQYRDVTRVIGFTALIVAYILIFPIVGFVITTTVMLFVGFTLLGSRRFALNVILSVVLSIGIYIVFTTLLHLPLPVPVLGGVLP